MSDAIGGISRTRVSASRAKGNEAASRGASGGSPGPLKEILRRIGEKGRITFAEFMEVSLYWPDGGYYTSPETRWGAEGDYITSLDVSPVFSRLLAKEIHEMWILLGSPGDFEVIEAGAGRGLLSRGMLDTMEESFPELYKAVRFSLVEKNPYLREGGKYHRDKGEDKVSWHGGFPFGSPVTGVILSNELLDSLPFHRVINLGGLKEIYTGFDGDSLVDVPGEPSTGELAGYFEDIGIELAEGQKAEAGLEAKEWIKLAGGVLERGFVVTIDYGLPSRELYSTERMDGSLLCHLRHTLNDNPYLRIGSQDITAHVDFTTIAKAGHESGLELTGFTTQKNFLLGLGILEELQEVTEPDLKNFGKISMNRAITELIMPGGMGDTFKVLIQHKGMVKPSLKGFSFKEMSSYL